MAEDRAGQVERLARLLIDAQPALKRESYHPYVGYELAEWLIERGVTVAPPPPKVTDAMVEAAAQSLNATYLEWAHGGYGRHSYPGPDRQAIRWALEAAWRAASSGEA